MVEDMRPSIRRNRRTQQALVGLSVVGALGAATTLDLTTQTASAGSGSTTTPAHARTRARATGSGGRVADDPAPASTPTPTPQAQPVAPPAGGSTQATTSGS